jgi:hypothetical protein
MATGALTKLSSGPCKPLVAPHDSVNPTDSHNNSHNYAIAFLLGQSILDHLCWSQLHPQSLRSHLTYFTASAAASLSIACGFNNLDITGLSNDLSWPLSTCLGTKLDQVNCILSAQRNDIKWIQWIPQFIISLWDSWEFSTVMAEGSHQHIK